MTKEKGSLHVWQRTDLKDLVLLGLVDFASQTAVGDGIMDDGLVGLGAGLLEEFGT